MARLDHPLAYLSAHPHGGFWAVHRTLASPPLLELNVSSLSNWPIACRRISFAYDAKARRLLVRGDLLPRGDLPNASYDDLLKAWEAQTCASTGPVPRAAQGRRRERDRAQAAGIPRQPDAMAALAPVCESCERPLYVHADSYQDGILQILLDGAEAIRASDVPLPSFTLPAWSGALGFADWARALMAEKPIDDAAQKDRRKAGLVAAVNDPLDDIEHPRAKAYMTCRAVQAARIDFEATDVRHKGYRRERHRMAEPYFRIEASVSME